MNVILSIIYGKKGEHIFQKSARVKRHPDLFVSNQTHNPFKIPLLNRKWEVFPGFVIWEIWIERNNRIFENRSRKEEDVWNTLKKRILKTLHLNSWGDNDLTSNAR